MKDHIFLRSFAIVAGVLLLIVAATILGNMLAAQTNVPPQVGKDPGSTYNVLTQSGQALFYSANDLGATGVTLPASSTTSSFPAAPINLSYVSMFTFGFNCGQAVDVFIDTYDADGVTALGSYKLFSAVPSGNQQVSVGQEVAPVATGGTAGVNIRLPQRAAKFHFGNTTSSASTCTARLFVQYH